MLLLYKTHEGALKCTSSLLPPPTGAETGGNEVINAMVQSTLTQVADHSL